MFDGAHDGTPSSTAEVARLLDAPIVLVVTPPGSGSPSRRWCRASRPSTRGPRRGGDLQPGRFSAPRRDPPDGPRVDRRGAARTLGRDDAFRLAGPPFGLVPVVEHPDVVRGALERLARAVERDCDSRPSPDSPRPRRDSRSTSRCSPHRWRRFGSPSRPAGPSASMYQDNLEALCAAGAELVPFDPCEDPQLPADCRALVAGGGFPEVYASDLADNRALLADVGRRIADGLVVWAECGGLLWLARSLEGRPMAGVVPTDGRMTQRLASATATPAPPARRRSVRPGSSCGATSSTTRASPHRTPARQRRFDRAADQQLGPPRPARVVSPPAPRGDARARHGICTGRRRGVIRVGRAGRPRPPVMPYLYPTSVRKTSVYLPESLKDELSGLARRWDRSEAELLRLRGRAARPRGTRRHRPRHPRPGSRARPAPGGGRRRPERPGAHHRAGGRDGARRRSGRRRLHRARRDRTGRSGRANRRAGGAGRPSRPRHRRRHGRARRIPGRRRDRHRRHPRHRLGRRVPHARRPNVYSTFPALAALVADLRPSVPITTVPG